MSSEEAREGDEAREHEQEARRREAEAEGREAEEDRRSEVPPESEPGGRAWTARVYNNDTTAANPFTVVAICLAAGGAG